MMSDQTRDLIQGLAEKYVAGRPGMTLGNKLGAGNSAVVYRADGSGGSCALKIYDPKFLEGAGGPAERHRLEIQRRLIGKHHDGLVDLHEIEFQFDTCFIWMEFLPWVELGTVLSKIPFASMRGLIRQLVGAVTFLENAKLVHRDIKAANILINDDCTKLKLVDLGVVRELDSNEDREDGTDHGLRRPFIATGRYSSPEYLFRLREPSAAFWKALSIYQVGTVLYEMLMRKPIFETEMLSDNRYKVAMAVLTMQPSFESISADADRELVSLAGYCLTKSMDLRLDLVDWGDFSDNGETAEAALKRKLSRAAAHLSSSRSVRHHEENLKISRASKMKLLSGQLVVRLIDSYRGEVKVTSEPVSEVSSFRLDIELPAGQVLHAWISTEWQRSLAVDMGHVSLGTSSTSTSKPDGLLVQVCEIYAPAPDVTAAVEALYQKLTEAMLALIDQSELQTAPSKAS